MARIRSIKPEFFTSETLARVPISARLTFIGLWTYVDDNGVGVANDRLIAAALYPLDDDPQEAFRRVSDDIRKLCDEGVVIRYLWNNKTYIFITSWDEHQKVSHPGKLRYARPNSPGVTILTSETTNPPESLRRDSGGSPESLRPEQGAGSREQGAGSSGEVPCTPARADDARRAPKRIPKSRPTVADGFDLFWKYYPRKVAKGDAEKAFTKAVREGADPTIIAAGAQFYALERKMKDPTYTSYPATWLNGRRWQDEADPTYVAPAAAARPSTTTAIVEHGMDLIQRMAAEEGVDLSTLLPANDRRELT